MKKQYEITQTRNGFIIEMKHKDKYYNDENKYIAHDLHEVVHVIQEDLNEEPIIE